LFIKAMENDLHKVEPLVFEHPKNKKPHKRRIMLCPANGNTLMVVGEFRNPMDFVYVIIVLNSKKYKHPYMVVENYTPQFRNPDTVAQMVINAYNRVLKRSGVQIGLEPWDNDGNPIMYVEDGWNSYNRELFMIQGRNLVRKGYEDALEMAKKEQEGKPAISKKSDDIRVYILHKKKDLVLKFLHHAVKGMKVPREIAMPFRFLIDHKFSDHIPYKAVIKELPELKGLMAERRYNEWTNQNRTDYAMDPRYKMLNDLIDMFL